jgi:hypothetical protein
MREPRRLIALGLALGLAARPAAGGDLRDLYFGEAIYHALQGHYFDALQRLDTELGMYRGLDEPQLDTLHYHINNAEFSVGDFELNYRMHHRAGRAIKAVLEGAVDEAVRNEAAFRLARIHFQKDQSRRSTRWRGSREQCPRRSRTTSSSCGQTSIWQQAGRASVKVSSNCRAMSLAGFVAHNLGIALLRRSIPATIQTWTRPGCWLPVIPGFIRDKSNLVRNHPVRIGQF